MVNDYEGNKKMYWKEVKRAGMGKQQGARW